MQKPSSVLSASSDPLSSLTQFHWVPSSHSREGAASQPGFFHGHRDNHNVPLCGV